MKPTRSENLKLVKGFYRALTSHDWSAARNVLASEIQWLEPVVPGLWFGGTHAGIDSVFREVIEPAEKILEKPEMKMKKFFDVGDHVIVFGKYHGKTKSTSMKLNAPLCHVWTIHDSRAVRVECFHDLLEWDAALGLTTIQAQKMAA